MELYLCFSSGNSLFDKLIKFVQRAVKQNKAYPEPMATHSYFLFKSPDGRQLGFEARPPTIRFWDMTAELRSRDRLYKIPFSEDQIRSTLLVCGTHVGQGYHWRGDFLAGFFCLTNITLPDRERLEFFCSQVCVNILRAEGLDCMGTMPDWDITPAILEIWAQQLLRKY